MDCRVKGTVSAHRRCPLAVSYVEEGSGAAGMCFLASITSFVIYYNETLEGRDPAPCSSVLGAGLGPRSWLPPFPHSSAKCTVGPSRDLRQWFPPSSMAIE